MVPGGRTNSRLARFSYKVSRLALGFGDTEFSCFISAAEKRRKADGEGNEVSERIRTEYSKGLRKLRGTASLLQILFSI